MVVIFSLILAKRSIEYWLSMALLEVGKSKLKHKLQEVCARPITKELKKIAQQYSKITTA